MTAKITHQHVAAMEARSAMTLTEFLLARIAEDEAWARARQREDFRRHRVSVHRTHLAPDDPSRVLRRCEADRRIVDLHDGEHHCTQYVDPGDNNPCATLLALAPAYADHPDYRDEWKP